MEEKKVIKISLKKFVFILIVLFLVALMVAGAILWVVNQSTNSKTKVSKIKSDSKNVRIKKYDGEKYYIIKDEYDGDYDLQYLYLSEFYGHENPINFEVEEVMSYSEYKTYCREWGIERNYSDKDMNYLVYSYLSYGAPNLEAELIDVIYKNKRADIYLWDDSSGVSADISAYVVIIPTENDVSNINIIPTITEKEFDDLKNNKRFYEDPYYPSLDKPIIYLYPTEETNVNVNLLKPENVTCSYPKYENGWDVLAKPHGDLIDLDTDRELYALYYEAKGDNDFKVEKEGFVIKRENIAAFLEEKLAILGLNERETEEFIVYWLPILQENEYNYIRFANQEEIEENMPLKIAPAPDSTIRIMMTFKGLDEPIEVEEQILETPERTGFVAVEWGGSEIK